MNSYKVIIDKFYHLEYVFHHNMFETYIKHHIDFMKMSLDDLIQCYLSASTIYFSLETKIPFSVSRSRKHNINYIEVRSNKLLRKDKLKRVLE